MPIYNNGHPHQKPPVDGLLTRPNSHSKSKRPATDIVPINRQQPPYRGRHNVPAANTPPANRTWIFFRTHALYKLRCHEHTRSRLFPGQLDDGRRTGSPRRKAASGPTADQRYPRLGVQSCTDDCGAPMPPDNRGDVLTREVFGEGRGAAWTSVSAGCVPA